MEDIEMNESEVKDFIDFLKRLKKVVSKRRSTEPLHCVWCCAFEHEPNISELSREFDSIISEYFGDREEYQTGGAKYLISEKCYQLHNGYSELNWRLVELYMYS